MGEKERKWPSFEEIDSWGTKQPAPKFPIITMSNEDYRFPPVEHFLPPQITRLIDLIWEKGVPEDIKGRAEASLSGAIDIIFDIGPPELLSLVSHLSNADLPEELALKTEALLKERIESYNLKDVRNLLFYGELGALLENSHLTDERLDAALEKCMKAGCIAKLVYGVRFPRWVREAAQVWEITHSTNRSRAAPSLPQCFTGSLKPLDERIFTSYVEDMVQNEKPDVLLSLYLIANGELPDGCSGKLSATMSRIDGAPQLLLRRLLVTIDSCAKEKPPSPHPQQCLTDHDITIPAQPPRLDRLRSLLQRDMLPASVRQKIEGIPGVVAGQFRKNIPRPKNPQGGGAGGKLRQRMPCI